MTYEIGSHVFDNWEIVREIGSGAYGKVYEIRRSDYGVTAKSALKVVRIPPSQSDVRSAMSDGMSEEAVSEYFRGFVRELIQEIQLMAELQSHTNIVSYQDHKVIDLKPEIGWDIQIRMELLESLVNYQIRNERITEQQIIKLGIDIASALEFCEKKQVIHRDIKPDNIFINAAGDFKLGDFGVARVAEKTTGGHSKKGTESYMAPEIYLGKPYGKTVDIYSLGLVLYRLSNQNRLPFYPLNTEIVNYHDREEALAKRMRGDVIPAPVNASPELTGIILKAVAYDPKERWQSAGELRKALKHVQSLKLLSTSEPIRFDYKETPEEDEETIGIIDKASPKGVEKESVLKTFKETGPEKEERRNQSIKTNQTSFQYTSGVIRQEEKERHQSFARNKSVPNSGHKGLIVLLIVAACIAAGIGVFLYFSKSGITDKTNESGTKNSSTEVLLKKEESETEKKSAAKEEKETNSAEVIVESETDQSKEETESNSEEAIAESETDQSKEETETKVAETIAESETEQEEETETKVAEAIAESETDQAEEETETKVAEAIAESETDQEEGETETNSEKAIVESETDQAEEDTETKAAEAIAEFETEQVEEETETNSEESIAESETDQAEEKTKTKLALAIAESETEQSEAETEIKLEEVSERVSETESHETSEQISEAEQEGALADASVGDYITFGSYEQDGDPANGTEPIEWLVLEREGDKILVISKYGLEVKRYNEEHIDITWENCTLRKWLNETFYEDAFSETEKQKIIKSTVKAEDNEKYGTEAGNDTEDNIFLLNISEATVLFNNPISRKCCPTKHAKAQGAYLSELDGSCYYWLRSPGVSGYDATEVLTSGQIDWEGLYFGNTDRVVRPALWIKLNSSENASEVEPQETSESALETEPQESSERVSEAEREAALVNASVGDYITFGSYEQDNNTANGSEPIEWLVLGREGDKILVISRYGLATREYNIKFTAVSWETCDLREWLNETFYEEAFSSVERRKIIKSAVKAEDDERLWTDPGKDTEDNIFLLSLSEAEELFNDDNARICYPTEYAKYLGCYVDHEYDSCSWWLRSPGMNHKEAGCVRPYGGCGPSSCDAVDVDLFCVRPTIWINLASYVDSELIENVQSILNSLGYECGTPDGIVGDKTRNAVKRYQEDHGFSVNGIIDDNLLNILGINE